MRDLIKKVLKEQIQAKELTGCDYLDKNSYDYKWCKGIAEKSLRINTVTASNAIKKYKNEFLSQYETGIRSKLYDPAFPFFSERSSTVKDALSKFEGSCPKFHNYIVYRMKEFAKSHVILNAKGEYDLLNKLNTNWSALALLLTLALPDEYKDLKKHTFLEAQQFFFKKIGENDGLTPFERFMGRWEGESMEDVKDKIYSTIRQKSNEGQEIEDEFYEFIKKYVPVKQYAGEYSFMDMIGVDMIIESPEGIWIPVQVKKYSGACLEQSSKDKKLAYRDFMCENWCVSYEKDSWRIKTFKGKTLQKNKEQCKDKPLNMTCFLNIHSHETDHESCEVDIPKINSDYDF